MLINKFKEKYTKVVQDQTGLYYSKGDIATAAKQDIMPRHVKGVKRYCRLDYTIEVINFEDIVELFVLEVIGISLGMTLACLRHSLVEHVIGGIYYFNVKFSNLLGYQRFAR
jgi:hypothetical protein